MTHPRNPYLTVDIIMVIDNSVVLIERKNEPKGWALPGGFVDYGESLEAAAAREAKEETNLDVFNLRQFRAYSDPDRDPRQHNVTIVFIAEVKGTLKSGDDAKNVGVYPLGLLPKLAFDHTQILDDYKRSVGYKDLGQIMYGI